MFRGLVVAGDIASLSKIKGVGKKTAERIIVELREKVAGALEQEVVLGNGEEASPRDLARDGLVNLGYAPLEAEQLLDGIDVEDAEQLIAAALRKAGTSRSKAA
jgi:Holliday junction DNA helicase RuvA